LSGDLKQQEVVLGKQKVVLGKQKVVLGLFKVIVAAFGVLALGAVTVAFVAALITGKLNVGSLKLLLSGWGRGPYITSGALLTVAAGGWSLYARKQRAYRREDHGEERTGSSAPGEA
jgi:CHASE2 domain-containing sensor protein